MLRATAPALPTMSSSGWMVMVFVAQCSLKATALRMIMGSLSVALKIRVLDRAPSMQTPGLWEKNWLLSRPIRSKRASLVSDMADPP